MMRPSAACVIDDGAGQALRYRAAPDVFSATKAGPIVASCHRHRGRFDQVPRRGLWNAFGCVTNA